jgi:DNA-binding transcriptional LysR family regulator
MLEQIETLLALKELETMGRAAARLRISQSAVSKRIKNLEHECGYTLLRTVGRQVRLTDVAESLILRARPLLAELSTCLKQEQEHRQNLILGVSESLLASAVPSVLKRILKEIPNLQIHVHAHRSPLAVEYVRSGRYTLALCTEPNTSKELESLAIAQEPMVIIPSGLISFDLKECRDLSILAIESGSATWAAISRQLPSFMRETKTKISVSQSLESFTAIAQMAKAGFGHGLVPLCIARSSHIDNKLIFLPQPGLYRPISLVGRKAILDQTIVQNFTERLRIEFSSVMAIPSSLCDA